MTHKHALAGALLALAPSLASAQVQPGLPSANTVYAGPATGPAAAPSFRPLAPADLGSALTSAAFDAAFCTTPNAMPVRGASVWACQTTLPGALMPGLTGDVASTAGTVATTIQPGVVTGSKIAIGTVANSNLANMAANTVKCNPTTSAAGPQDCAGFHWGPTSAGVPTSATGEVYYDNTGGYAEHNAALNLVTDLGALAPSGVVPALFIFDQCQGNNTTFVGCSGLFVQTQDRPGVTSGNKGVLYGLNVNIAPSLARNNSPFDDAVGLIVTNVGTGAGTEAIFVGHSGSVATDWGTGLGIQESALQAIYAVGTYTYGITFAHGSNATFSNGGGVLLVPPPSTTTPVLTVGSDAFTPSNNKNAIAVDANAQVIFVGQGAWFNFGNNARYVYDTSNVGGVFPLTAQGLATGGNFSNGSSEIDFFNTTTSAIDGFRFYQQTGASTATLLLDVTTAGHGIFAGYVKSGAATVASLPTCNAASEGARHYVTDQNTAVSYRGAVTGGGTTRQAVLCSNSAWIQD